MNKQKALLSWKGRPFKIRPIAIRLDDRGERLSPADDTWTVLEVSKEAAVIKNQRTEHQHTLGLDNVREFRTPDFLVLQCQLTLQGPKVISEPLIITTMYRSLSGFEAMLKHSWVKEIIRDSEVWISEVDTLFQIEQDPVGTEFHEPWTQKFPDKINSSAYPVRLKIEGVEIKELRFVACDGGRIFVPIPHVRSEKDKRIFEYFRDSLEYKIGQVIGSFDHFKTLENVARFAGIEVL